jgi:hypothetical protein
MQSGEKWDDMMAASKDDKMVAWLVEKKAAQKACTLVATKVEKTDVL